MAKRNVIWTKTADLQQYVLVKNQTIAIKPCRKKIQRGKSEIVNRCSLFLNQIKRRIPEDNQVDGLIRLLR